MRLGLSLLIGLSVVGCAPAQTNSSTTATGLAAFSEQLKVENTVSLCATYILPDQIEQTRFMIEAELAIRGINQCGGANIGIRSAALMGVSRYPRSGDDTGVNGRDYDCGDFSSAALAQRFFLASGGPATDRHNLDGDGDGLACEWGTQIRQIASRQVRVPQVQTPVYSAPRRSTGGACHTGPRGGTYTITSSGARDYDGC
jgi:hypothetical protein